MIQEYKQTYEDTSVAKQSVCNWAEVQKGSTGGGSRIWNSLCICSTEVKYVNRHQQYHVQIVSVSQIDTATMQSVDLTRM